MGTMIINQWNKWGNIIIELREDIESPDAFIDFEYLYNQIKKVRTPEYFKERQNEVKQETK